MSSKPSKCEEENQKKVEITKTPRKFDEKKLNAMRFFCNPNEKA